MPETISVRVDEDVQKEFKQLAEASGLKNNGDFMKSLLALYAVERAKEQTASLAPAIYAINDLMSRINTILAGTGEQIRAEQEKKDLEVKEKTDGLQNTVMTLKEEIGKHLDKIAKLREQCASAAEQSENIKKERLELSKTLDDKTALINELTSTNETLRSSVESLKLQLRDSERALIENRELRERLTEYGRQLEDMKIDKDKSMLALEIKLNAQAMEKQKEYTAALNNYETTVRDLLGRIASHTA